MSFRELRNFTEGLRELNFPRVVSVENFRDPNFPLVAELLFHLLYQAAPDEQARIPSNIETEDDRIDFLRICCDLAFASLGVTLNAVKLYAADGKAVKELLKISTLLQQAQRKTRRSSDLRASGEAQLGADEDLDVSLDGGAPTAPGGVSSYQVPALVGQVRDLAHAITQGGAKLSDLLVDEVDASTMRRQALDFLQRIAVSGNIGSGSHSNRRLDREEEFLRQSLQELLEGTEKNIQEKATEVSDLSEEDKALQGRIERRQADLDRAEKRLRALTSVRPAFMDEYEAVEAQLARFYEEFVVKTRNLSFLEQELQSYDAAERELMSEGERIRQHFGKKITQEEMDRFLGEGYGKQGGRGKGSGGESSDDDDGEDLDGDALSYSNRKSPEDQHGLLIAAHDTPTGGDAPQLGGDGVRAAGRARSRRPQDSDSDEGSGDVSPEEGSFSSGTSRTGSMSETGSGSEGEFSSGSDEQGLGGRAGGKRQRAPRVDGAFRSKHSGGHLDDASDVDGSSGSEDF